MSFLFLNLNKVRKISLTLISFFILFFFNFKESLAHVRYLIDEEDVEKHSGTDSSFLLDAITDITNIRLILVTIILVLLAYVLADKVKFIRNKFKEVSKKADTYKIFIPWILRLSLGITLIGSGAANTLISPALQNFDYFSAIQIFLGFLIMAGFLVIPAAISAVAIYFFALTQDIYVLGNLDYAMIALSLIVLDNEKPGLDDLLGITKMSPLCKFQNLVPMILRIGIGFSMTYLALYEKLLNPRLSEIIVRDFGLTDVVPVSIEMWVLSAGIIELFIGLLLLVGLFTRISVAIAFIVLSLSFFYFGEDVSSHITLFGTLSVLFITKGGKFSLDRNKKVKKFL